MLIIANTAMSFVGCLNSGIEGRLNTFHANRELKMTEDTQQTFLVRPLGKYGHAYLLSKQQYFLYRAFLIIIYGAMFILLWVKTLAPEFCENNFLFLCNLAPSIVLTATILGAFGQWKIASFGRLLSPEEATKYSAKNNSSRLFFRGLYWFGTGIASSGIAMMLIFSIYTRFLVNRPRPIWAWILLVICLYIPFHSYRKLRNARKVQ